MKIGITTVKVVSGSYSFMIRERTSGLLSNQHMDH